MEQRGDEPAAGDESVVVRLGQDRWALPLTSVGEVGRVPRLTRVPGLPPWVAGLGNWRGRVLAVVDLRPLLGVPAEPLGRTGRLVVVRAGDVVVGLLAEAVDGTVAICAPALEPVLPSLPAEVAGLLAGQVTTPTGPLGVLSVPALLALSARLPRVRRSA